MVKQFIKVEVLKHLMLERDITVKKMAELMNVTSSTVQKILSGSVQKQVSFVTVFKIARALNVSMSEFMSKASV